MVVLSVCLSLKAGKDGGQAGLADTSNQAIGWYAELLTG